MANISSIIIYLYVWKNPVIVPTDAQLNDCDVAGPLSSYRTFYMLIKLKVLNQIW